jgi:hypothetical protein
MPGCNFSESFVTESDDGSFAFSEEELAVASWKLSYSNVPEANVTFHRHSDVSILNVHVNGAQVGQIRKMWYGGHIYDSPEHL